MALLPVTEWMGIITMKINNFGYLVKEGFVGIFRHGFMSFAAVFVTIACLIVIGSFSALMYNLNQIVEREADNAQIIAYIQDDYTRAEAKSVDTEISSIENVQDAEFETKEEALKKFIAGQEKTYEGVQASAFEDRVVITLVDSSLMKETVLLIEAIPGVAEVRADFDLAEGFEKLQTIVRVISAAAIGLLLAVSLFIISNTIKIAMYDRRDQIAIMKMVGATNGFIRFPFVVEGFLIGVFGATVAFFAEWGLYNWLAGWITSMGDLQKLLEFVPFTELFWPMVAIFGAAGVFVGLFGSFASIRKFLNV